MSFRHDHLFSTYSIVARDAATGEMGIGVQTHQLAVGRVVLWLLRGYGGIATQSFTNVDFGPMTLAMLRANLPAERIIDALVTSDQNAHRRQLGVIDSQGNAAAFTGDGCIPEAGHYVGDGYAVQANMMTNTTVIQKMRVAYEGTKGDLASRIIAALHAAQGQGGDIRGMQSAAIKIVPGNRNVPEYETTYDLRVDEHPDPVTELERLVRLRRGQLISSEGHNLLEEGKIQEALTRWKDARDAAPEQTELAFWQAIALADKNPDDLAMSLAGRILALALEDNDNQENWIELIRRLDEVNVMQRPGAAEELLQAYYNTIG